MHSILFQIGTTPLSKQEYIDADNIENGDMVSIDYAYEIETEERAELISDLATKILPNGMFSIDKDGETLTYNGGFAQWRMDYLSLIQAKTADITTENIMKWIGPAFQLQKAVVNPLLTDVLFVTDYTAERSREFMIMVSRMQRGEKLYIGAILHYHF